MAKDVPKKIVARQMMKMTNELNAKYFKAKEGKVACGTCHQGKSKPPQ